MRRARLRWFIIGALSMTLAFAGLAVASPTTVSTLVSRIARLEQQQRLQGRIDLVIGNRLDALEQGPIVAGGIGSPITVAPRSWGTATARCLTGKAVGGGFESNYPVEVGTSHLANGQWEVAAYNANISQAVVFNATVVCI